MNHERFEEMLNLYIDSALDDERSAELFAHLGTCADCRAQLKTLTVVRAAVKTERAAVVPSSLDVRVLSSSSSQRIRSEGTFILQDLWNARISIPLPAASSFAVLLVVASLIAAPFFLTAPDRAQTPVDVGSIEQLRTQYYESLMRK